jgi:hypothetical protein
MVSAVRRTWLALAGVVLLAGCATSGEVDSDIASVDSFSSPLASALSQVDWPEDAATVDAAFSALPKRIGNADLVNTQRRDPDDEGSYYQWYYESESGYGSIEVSEAASPDWRGRVHEMIALAVWSGFPDSCVDADVSVPFNEFFAQEMPDLPDGDDSWVPADPGGLLWVACTSTRESGGQEHAEDNLNYVAHWSDGEAVYSVDTWKEDMRAQLIAALVDAVQHSG